MCYGLNMTTKEYHRAWYQRNKVRRAAQINASRKRRIRYMYEEIKTYKTHKGCADCKETDPIVLEFDHLKDKEDDVSKMLYSARPWCVVLREIEKCDVVCRNCHARRTFSRRAPARTCT